MEQAVLKLTSGETIIADVVSKGSADVIVSNPMLVRNGINEENKLVVTLLKWIETEQPSVTIGQQHVITTAHPSRFLLSYYNEVLDFELQEDQDESLYEDYTVTSEMSNTTLH